MTFGGGAPCFYDAVGRIKKQAASFRIFDSITGFTDTDLRRDTLFWAKHGDFIEGNPKYYGYALWKSYLILKMLRQINEGEILLYVDCGCELNSRGKARLVDYLRICAARGSLAFQLDHAEKTWSKMDLIHHLKAPVADRESGQVAGGMIFLTKSERNLQFAQLWFETQTSGQYHFINDAPSLLPNDPSFVEHRHDQSCFSLLTKRYGHFVIPDETYFAPDWLKGIGYPIWAARNKTGRSVLPRYSSLRFLFAPLAAPKRWIKSLSVRLGQKSAF